MIPNALIIRSGVSGDFYTQAQANALMRVADARPIFCSMHTQSRFLSSRNTWIRKALYALTSWSLAQLVVSMTNWCTEENTSMLGSLEIKSMQTNLGWNATMTTLMQCNLDQALLNPFMDNNTPEVIGVSTLVKMDTTNPRKIN